MPPSWESPPDPGCTQIRAPAETDLNRFDHTCRVRGSVGLYVTQADRSGVTRRSSGKNVECTTRDVTARLSAPGSRASGRECAPPVGERSLAGSAGRVATKSACARVPSHRITDPGRRTAFVRRLRTEAPGADQALHYRARFGYVRCLAIEQSKGQVHLGALESIP